MSPLPWDRVSVALLAILVLACTVLSPSVAGYAALAFAGIFAMVFWLTRDRTDRIFFLACAGVLSVAACGAVSAWEGLAASWLVMAVIASILGVVVTIDDVPALFAAGIATALVTLAVALADHVLPALALVLAAGVIVLCVLAVRNYRFRKHYSGGIP